MGCGTNDIETKRGKINFESSVSCLVLLIVDEQNCQLICCLILSCIIRLQAGVSDVEGKIDILFWLSCSYFLGGLFGM